MFVCVCAVLVAVAVFGATTPEQPNDGCEAIKIAFRLARGARVRMKTSNSQMLDVPHT